MTPYHTVPITPGTDESASTRWTRLFNEAFGANGWKILSFYPGFAHVADRRGPISLVAVLGAPGLIVVQEFKDGGFDYYFQSSAFKLGDCLLELRTFAKFAVHP